MKLRLAILTALLSASGALYAQSPSGIDKPGKLIKVADREPNGDEELALAALEGLMAQSSERALPILKRVLAGPQSALVKQRALFVLGQIDSPEARQILAQTARSTDASLRGEAIRSIGIGGDPKALDSLVEIYNTGNADVKQEVLQAWLIANHKQAVYQVAANAKSEDEANAAIRILGAMGAGEELRKLGDRPNTSKGLLEAYAISGDFESLRKVAEGNGDRELRLVAIRNMGIVDSDASRTALRDIYSRATDAEIKDAALQGLLISGDDKGVLALYRASKSPDEKRALLRTLSMFDSDAALEAIDQALGEKK